MNRQQSTDPGSSKYAVRTPRDAVAEAQRRLTGESRVDIASQWISLDGGLDVHFLEAGTGEPLILLHGSGNNAASWVPLLEHLDGRRVIAVDRPGYGLSDPMGYRREDYRQTTVGLVTGLLDALAIERADLVGNSTGSLWAIWTALDQPNRVKSLTTLGATPLLPGTSPTLPLRLMTTPVIGDLLGKLLPDPSPDSVVKMMGGMGEAGTIVEYPRLVDVFVAAGSDPIAGETAQKELSVMIRGIAGFRRQYRFPASELESLTHRMLLIWGDHDPIGDTLAAHTAQDTIPNAQLEVLPTGHAPWWGEPERVAALISSFLAAGERATS